MTEINIIGLAERIPDEASAYEYLETLRVLQEQAYGSWWLQVLSSYLAAGPGSSVCATGDRLGQRPQEDQEERYAGRF